MNLHLANLHLVNITFRQLIHFVNCENGLKFMVNFQIRKLTFQQQYQQNKFENIFAQISKKLKISVGSQIQYENRANFNLFSSR